MTLSMCITVGILFAVSAYLLMGRDLKEVCIGIFLLGHGANLAIIAVSRTAFGSYPPILGEGHAIDEMVDPLPQALVLTAIVIGFAVQAFLLTLLVITYRRTGSLDAAELADVNGSATPLVRQTSQPTSTPETKTAS